MRSIFMVILTIGISFVLTGQPLAHRTIEATPESEAYWAEWLADLYEVGVVIEDGKLTINDEARRILKEDQFRSLIYPEQYTWEAASVLLKKMELKKGFWYLINLYHHDPDNREKVIQSLIPFEEIMEMDNILVSTFYTYAMFEPTVCTITDGTPDIHRPDLVEAKFNSVKEIVKYIHYFRENPPGSNRGVFSGRVDKI